MQNLFNVLGGMNPFATNLNNQIVEQEDNAETTPGYFSSIVTGTISISKMIFGKSFDSHSLNIPLPYYTDDIWKVIFSKLNFKELFQCSSVSKEFCKLINEPILSKKMIYEGFCFNPSHWNSYSKGGIISNEEIEKAFKSLPININEILKSPCPAFPGKKVMDTHMLVWIPETIKGKVVTIDSFGKFLKQELGFEGNRPGYEAIRDDIAQQEGGNPIKSGWVLMTNDVIPDSRSKSYAEQQELVASLNKLGQTGYRVPKTGEAIVCIMAEYLRYNWYFTRFTNTRCQENIGDYQVVVGDFVSSGLSVAYYNSDSDEIGVACLREL